MGFPAMVETAPATAREVAQALREACVHGQSVGVEGHGSKRAMGGPIRETAVQITTRSLNAVLQFEPRDLTISVQAGLPWKALEEATARHGLCVPLDPPFAAQATVGGVVATNSCGPRRRLYGSARDLVIGMEFATLDGALGQSGGMVVKNVAGYDVQKLLTGSFGTLAVITTVNFKLTPAPETSRTFILSYASAPEAAAARDSLLRSPLQPAALDLVNPAAAAELGLAGYCLLLCAQGPAPVLDRYQRELPAAACLEQEADAAFWEQVREFLPRRLSNSPATVVVRCGHPLPGLGALLESTASPILARAATGTAWFCFSSLEEARHWLGQEKTRSWSRVIEFAPPAVRATAELWPAPGEDLVLMKRMKELFDPKGLLNPGRLYGRI